MADPNDGGRAAGKTATGTLDRRVAVKQLLDSLDDDVLIVAGLAGAKGDVTAAVGDDPRVFGFGGAMGAAASMGLGLALAQPDRRVLVVTGDGELLMNVGTLATIAVANPPNLGIICVDNEHYGETGFQRSHTGLGTDLATMAQGGGIGAVRTVREMDELDEAGEMLRNSNGAAFVLLKVAVNDPPKMPTVWDASWHKSRFRQALLGKP
ncbi:MAG: thiamine pyrophosphate-dependent enzyme [Alphaproteobacteria bacterium]|jgi:phosphonopyruvate decarboxylase|nr:thiamine pyrophosphate-dependent enzyme [Alphaproteobacteria bacterium]MDP6831221.1 thiamine pyrophosphate-dependent enzyme [Alphaproteobacteria bacterium]